MTYKETLEYLFEKTPMFQNRGAVAYKAGIDGTLRLSKHYNEPHKHYKTIHVAGTNGKGSTSHTIAAVLSSSGYKVGLFTSPHLLDFSERIRINGQPISQDYVVNFVSNAKDIIDDFKPSFFELTTIMAFCYFRDMQVDIAVIETGMGGREDSTNIISPILSIITNISYDHTQFLGKSLQDIALHKAGIIKDNTPVIVGRKDKDIDQIFINEAKKHNSNIIFAPDFIDFSSVVLDKENNVYIYKTNLFGKIEGQLTGIVQKENTKTILSALSILKNQLNITNEAICNGFRNVVELTGLQGRFQLISKSPITICDTAHNVDGIKNIVVQLGTIQSDKLHIVFGMVSDKDINSVISLLPKNALYYFTKANNKRSQEPSEIYCIAKEYGLKGNVYTNVEEAYKEAKKNANISDCIFIGGSNFIVADFLEYIREFSQKI